MHIQLKSRFQVRILFNFYSVAIFQRETKLTNYLSHFRLTKYLPHSRNLMRVRDPEKRMSLLKCGRLPVVSFLSELPQTEHDPQSFAVDLTLFTVNVFFFY